MSSNRSNRRRLRSLNIPASWDGIELDSPFGARTREELAEIRADLIGRSYPGFGKGLEFLKMRPPRPYEVIPGHWTSYAILERYPDELYEDRTWAPNWPGDYVGIRFRDTAYLERRHELLKRKGPVGKPYLYAEGMDDTDETLELPDDATGLEVIRLLIAGQPLCRADFWGLGFHPT